MIREFVLKNLSTLEEVKFGQDIDCDYVYESGGLDWGSIPATHSVYNYPGQIGDNISSTKVNNRDVTIQAYAYYILDDEEKRSIARENWSEYTHNKIKQKKEVLNRLINPLNFVRLTIGDYYIEGKPSATVQYGAIEAENNVYFCKFMISIFCADPMFKKITQTITAIAGDSGSFFFPLFFQPIGKIFGVRNNFLMLEAQNEGDIEIGGVITIEAKGEIINPSLENLSNGHKIKINKTMSEGDVIVINTVDGSAKGIWSKRDLVTASILYAWDFDNDWMKFEPGTSLISYTCDNQNEIYMDVKIEINPARYGLEDM